MKKAAGVPQGSVLGPLLFLIFINNLDEEVATVEILAKFADNTKVAQIVRSLEESKKLQEALNKLVEWAARWGMEFNMATSKLCIWAMPMLDTAT